MVSAPCVLTQCPYRADHLVLQAASVARRRYGVGDAIRG